MIEIILVGFLIVFAVFGYKLLDIYGKSKQNQYKLAKKKLKLAKKQANDDEYDEVDEFIESLPPWLSGVADGAGIDMEKLYMGDTGEIEKVKNVLNKLPGSQGDQGGFL